MVYKEGCTDRTMTRRIQEFLGIAVDGIFGKKTTAAVIKYQMDNNLVADGIVGRNTLNSMGILDSDIGINSHFKTSSNLTVERYYLPKGEYLEDPHTVLNDYLVLHHTAGWNNPYKQIDGWGRDERGAVATEFVVGGVNIKTGDDQYDGKVLQAFPEGCAGWHVASTKSSYLNRHAVGIEVCNFGFLTKSGDSFRTYVNGRVLEAQVVTLEKEFRGYRHWHKYTDNQLLALKHLILYIAQRDNIDIDQGIIKWLREGSVEDAFSYRPDAEAGKIKGLLLHCNVVKTKVDMFPQQELIDMLLSL